MSATMIAPAKIKELEEQLPELDIDRAMNYSLADAIREGSSVTQQCIGNWQDSQGNLCALSAGLLALKARHLA